MKAPTTKHCAIYTRKSSEEGLDQHFNSLDAQREACEAYVQSQKHEGWKIIKEQYNDGGFSGGTMKRPALTQLLEHLQKRKVDIIVVYKVDRLSRSLADFAKLVELFDGHEVSFVSVTQQFNTSSSMGRLTLNVLLSFAQFEREVTGERIRDKIAASKKKGLWMGGNIPLGYDVIDRKLIINRKEAKTVRAIFKQYLEFKSVKSLKLYLDTSNNRTKQGKPFSRGALYKLLGNPLYVGKVRHKQKIYEGEHSPILKEETWEKTQILLKKNRRSHEARSTCRSRSPLAGKLFDDRGNRMTPSHAKKGNKRYRYYVSQALLQHQDKEAGSIPRIPAKDIETVVIQTLRKYFTQSTKLLKHLGHNRSDLNIILRIQDTFDNSDDRLNNDKLMHVIEKVVIEHRRLYLEITRERAAELFCIEPMKSGPFSLTESVKWEINSEGHTLIIDGQGQSTNIRSREALMKSVVRALLWNLRLLDGSIESLSQIGKEEELNASYVRRIMRLAYLAPETIKSILTKTRDIHLTLESFRTKESFSWQSK